MESNVLRTPLIRSAAVLAALTLLVYVTGASPEAGVTGSIWLIIKNIFGLIWFVIGLVLSIAVCLAVFYGIFVGAIAMVSRESASRMNEQLLIVLAGCLAKGKGVSCKTVQTEAPAPVTQGEEVAAVVPAAVESDALQAVTERLDKLEAASADMVTAEQFNQLSRETADTTESLTAIREAIDGLRADLDGIAAQLQDMTPEKLLAEQNAKLGALENEDRQLSAKLDSVLSEVQAANNKAGEALKQADEALAGMEGMEERLQAAGSEVKGDEGEFDHRIFSYLPEQADKEQLVELVGGTLKQDMTYAQVIDFLVKTMESAAAKEIEAHPSLIKDYIRQCRKAAL